MSKLLIAWLSKWVWQNELVSEWESEIDRMSKRERECENKGLMIHWSSDPLIKRSSYQAIKWSNN